MNSLLPKIVLFDDESSNLEMYQHHFKEHFAVSGFQNPFHYPQALEDNVAAILIDVIMPLKDGVTLYKELLNHPAYNGCPVIFMSASGSDQILVKAMASGGQDFLTKSMHKDEMISRISNKITYFRNHRQIYRLGNVKIQMNEFKATCDNQDIELTLTQLRIMKHLICRYPRLVPREDINQEVWPGQVVMPTTLNTHLSNLRQKFNNWEYEIQIAKFRGVQLVKRS